MTSHEYAQKMQAVVDLLNKSPEFTMPSYMDGYVESYGVQRISFHSNKELFLSAVKGIGHGKKGGDSNTLEFISGDLRLTVYRSSVCRLVKEAQPAQYDCEPLLSQMEEASLDR